MGPANCRTRRHCLCGRTLLRRGRTTIRARIVVGGRVRNCRHATLPGEKRPRRFSRGVPRGQGIERTRQRVEITSEPTRTGRRLRVGGAPDVRGLEVGPARVRIPGSLHERETPFVEYVQQSAKPRMQPERVSGRVGTNLQHLSRRNRNARPATVVRPVLIRDQRVECIVAAAKVDDDEATRRYALRLRDSAQEGRCREAECDGRNAVTDEKSSGYAHGRCLLNELIFGGADEEACEAGGSRVELLATAGPRPGGDQIRHQGLLRGWV
jgi:hypothetical protein